MTDILAEARYPGWMDDDEELAEPLLLEVRTDPWALARLYEAPERAALVELGFEHLGYVFQRVPGMEWERADVGYTIEVLADQDRTTVASLELFFDVGVVSLETLLQDGRIVSTRYVPEAVFEEDALFARLAFASTPRAGRLTRDRDTWDAAGLLSDHLEAVRALRAGGVGPVVHDMVAYFAIQERTEDVAEAKADVFGAVIRGWMGVAGVVLLVDAAWATGWLHVPGSLLAAAHLGLAIALFATPWVRLAGALTRVPLVTADALLALPEVRKRVGDHVVHAAR